MFAEVVARPPGSTTAPALGTSSSLAASPLRVGRSAHCDLRLEVALGHDLLLGLVRGVPTVWAERGAPVQCSLNGRPIENEHPLTLTDGDFLVFVTGLVLALRERPVVIAKNEVLERAVAERPDDSQALAVYVDFLREHGDPLADWLSGGRHDIEAERFRAFGALSESARAFAVQPVFSDQGLVTSLRLARHAVVGKPGLFWHLEQLASVPVLRTLNRLDIDYVVGTPATFIVPPTGVESWPQEPPFELVAHHLVEILERLGPRTARTVRLGFAPQPPRVGQALLEAVRRTFPRWDRGPLVLQRGS